MKKLLYIFAIALVISPVFAFAGTQTIEGKFMGANCMFFNKSCPMDMTEGHIATEPDFVVTKSDGTYYYIVNLDRSVKARHLHNDVRVTGKLNDKNTMIADKLEVRTGGSYKTIWTLAQELEERRKINEGR